MDTRGNRHGVLLIAFSKHQSLEATSTVSTASKLNGLLITYGEFTAFQPARWGYVGVNTNDVPTTVLITAGYDGGIALCGVCAVSVATCEIAREHYAKIANRTLRRLP